MAISVPRISELFEGRDEVPIDEIAEFFEKIKIELEDAKAKKDSERWHKLTIEYYTAEYLMTSNLLDSKMIKLNEGLGKSQQNHIEVIELDNIERTVTLKISNGIERDELVSLWNKVIKELGVSKKTESELVQDIVRDRNVDRLSYSALARKYYPNELDIESSKDKIKKIIKRNAFDPWLIGGDKFLE